MASSDRGDNSIDYMIDIEKINGVFAKCRPVTSVGYSAVQKFINLCDYYPDEVEEIIDAWPEIYAELKESRKAKVVLIEYVQSMARDRFKAYKEWLESEVYEKDNV